MSRIPFPLSIEASVPGSRPLLEAVQKQLGVVPNLHRLLGLSPAAMEGYLGLNRALERSFDAPTRQRVAVRIAELNGCDYCLSAHTYLGKSVAKLDDPELAAARAGRSADPTANAALRFVTDVMQARGHISADSLGAARSAGLSDAQLVELVGHIALSTFTNFLNSVAETEIDFPRLSTEAAYDGFCAVAVAMGERVPSDVGSTSYHDGRKFRFSSPEAKAMFDANPADFAARADARWPISA